MSVLRTLVYFLCIGGFSVLWCPVIIACFWAPHHVRRDLAKPWVSVNNWLVWHVLGITFTVEGREHIPAGACVVLAKHQSPWETFVLQDIFRDTAFVWKRELRHIPFFGWALATQPMIPLNREGGAGALRALTKIAAERIAQGYTVVIFPEGTRSPVGQKGDYKVGGALMASKAKVPALPVALDSGECWQRSVWSVRPGRITVSIGPPIDTRGLGAAEITSRAEHWIETEMRRIAPHRYPDGGGHGAA